MSDTAISKKQAAFGVMTTAIVSISAKSDKDMLDLYCVMILAGILLAYLIAQTIIDINK